MMRFIDLGKQIAVDETDPDYPRQFAFYDTVSDTFIMANGGSVFDSWDEFLVQAADELDLALINRLKRLCPPWVFGDHIDDGAKLRVECALLGATLSPEDIADLRTKISWCCKPGLQSQTHDRNVYIGNNCYIVKWKTNPGLEPVSPLPIEHVHRSIESIIQMLEFHDLHIPEAGTVEHYWMWVNLAKIADSLYAKHGKLWSREVANGIKLSSLETAVAQ